MRVNSEFLGTASIIPSDDITAGQIGTWEIEYTVGKYGIDDRGTMRIAWRNVSDWATPQFDDPKGLGYTTVTTTGKAKIKVEMSTNERPFIKCIRIYVFDGYLCEGDKVNIIMGDTSGGSAGIRAQSFREADHEFKVLVDPYGSRKYVELPEIPKINIVGGEPHSLQLLVPSIVRKGKEFDAFVRCIDEYGNPANDFDGEIQLYSKKYGVITGDNITIKSGEKPVKTIGGNVVDTSGPLHLYAKCEKYKMEAISNGIVCNDDEEYNLYWGDMHGQTSLTIGTGTLDEFFSFARDFGRVDFTGWQGNDFEIDNEKWLSVRNKVKEYNDEGNFLAFLGYEWSGVSAGGGDHNIFFSGDNDTFYPSSNWSSQNKGLDISNNAYPISELWDKVKGREDVMAIPHVGGRHGNFDYYDEDCIPLIEVHSHHGTFDWFALEAMKREMKVGFVASSDDHTCRMGISYPLCLFGSKGPTSFDVISGFVGVYSKNLTKESVWEALKARRCYASTFNRLNLDVKIENYYMGEEIDLESPPTIDIKCVGSSPIENIKVYNGVEVLLDKHMLDTEDNKTNIKKIKVAWSGVRLRTRGKSANWNGMINVDGAKILKANEICFDRVEQGIKLQTDKYISWESSTSGDIDGLEMTVDSSTNGKLSFVSDYINFTVNINDIDDEIKVYDAGGENLKVEVSSANKEIENEQTYIEKCAVDLSYKTKVINDGFNAYWIKITQVDGNMAWSSPIFVNKK